MASAFAGLNANTLFFNLTWGLAMFAGRFLVIVPVLCIAGGKACRAGLGGDIAYWWRAVRRIADRHGADRRRFHITVPPALALGPVAEQLAMQAGMTY